MINKLQKGAAVLGFILFFFVFNLVFGNGLFGDLARGIRQVITH